MIKGLYVGKTYTLTETIAPDGYQVAQSIEFTVDDTGDIQRVEMYDDLLILPETGDNMSIDSIIQMCLLSGIVFLGIYIYLKRESV